MCIWIEPRSTKWHHLINRQATKFRLLTFVAAGPRWHLAERNARVGAATPVRILDRRH